jgi:hypothetical protein
MDRLAPFGSSMVREELDKPDDEEPAVAFVETELLELATDPILFAVPIGGDC